jgi:hypothetical protein
MFGFINGCDGIQVKHALTASSAFMQQELMGVDLHIWRWRYDLGTY